MAYNSLPAHQLPADDTFFNPTSSNLPVTPGTQSLYGSHDTFGQIYAADLKNEFYLIAAGDGCDPQKQSIGRHGPVMPSNLNPIGPKPRPAPNLRLLSNTLRPPQASQETTPGFSADRLPSVHGNLQYQPGWGIVSPPLTSIPFAQPSTSQQHSNNSKSPPSMEQTSVSQPKSVKHLTCWYWANQGCKLPDHLCLYSHFDTGRLAEAPIQLQRGRPAVAGRNATNVQPVYNNWKSHHQAHSAVAGTRIQKQLKRIHDKAAVYSTQTSIQAEQSAPVDIVYVDRRGFTETATDYDRPHSGDFTSPTPTDPYPSRSVDTGAFGHPIQQHLSHSPHQTGDLPPSPAAQHESSWTQHGGLYGGTGGHQHMSGSRSSPRQFGGNSPNNLNASAASGHNVGLSSRSTEDMLRQIKVKDKVITELAGIVESLEINYGISIDDQTQACRDFLTIAHSMKAQAREAGGSASPSVTRGKYHHRLSMHVRKRLTPPVGRAPNVPAPSTSTPPYGHPPANHERIVTAMDGFWNLVTMEKMALAKSNARKRVVGRELEGVGALSLLPHGWLER